MESAILDGVKVGVEVDRILPTPTPARLRSRDRQYLNKLNRTHVHTFFVCGAGGGGVGSKSAQCNIKLCMDTEFSSDLTSFFTHVGRVPVMIWRGTGPSQIQSYTNVKHLVYSMTNYGALKHHHHHHIYLASHTVTSELHTYTTDTTQTIQVHYALQAWHDNKAQ